eukprot:NODE_70_length_24940_cov_0.663138.p22 type:complete len:126 gc:universal NODE_70_length_24940_cov_0.663138:1076-1453(+)
MGNLQTGLFAQRYWSDLDGTKIIYSGAIEGEMLIVWQFISCLVTFAWSFVITVILLYGINLIPGLSLTIKNFDAEKGLDEQEMGEATYDYLKLINKPKPTTRDIGTYTHQQRWFRRDSEKSDKSQ